MTHEIPFPGYQRDPAPKADGVQKITLFEGGGWKRVIECPKEDDQCDGDYELRSKGAENARRGASLRRRMGVSG